MAVSEGALKQSSVKWSAKAWPSGSSAHKESTSSPRKHASAVGFNGPSEESAGTWQPGGGGCRRPSSLATFFNRQLWKTPETTTEWPRMLLQACFDVWICVLQGYKKNKKTKSIFRFQNKVVSIKQTRNVFLLGALLMSDAAAIVKVESRVHRPSAATRQFCCGADVCV